MPIYVYPDRIEFPNYSLRIDDAGLRVTTPTGTTANGTFSAAALLNAPLAGVVAGYTSGGINPLSPAPTTSNVIDRFPFATNANASDVGDLSVARYYGAGQSSSTFGYHSGGLSSNVIDRFPFAVNANATDAGDLSAARGTTSGHSSSVSGYSSGGDAAPTGNVIDRFPFAAIVNATDVGDLTIARRFTAGQSSSTAGFVAGGLNITPGVYVNTIDSFPFATNANATDISDISVAKEAVVGQSSTTSGYVSGGTNPTIPAQFINVIEKFPFATNTNATDIADLSVARYYAAGQSSTSFGFTSGGFGTGSVTSNVIDKFPFVGDANATDVGDLTLGRYNPAGQQN